MADKLSQFMEGFITATQLANRAAEKGYFIESVCLTTSIIDAALRIALILKHQIENQNNEVINELLYQGEDDKAILEKTIYKRALQKKIINQELFTKLNQLYLQRNRVVHRYIISEIKTKDVLIIAAELAEIVPIVSKEIRKLEDKQLELGIGMTRSDADVSKTVKEGLSATIERAIESKHGDENLNKNLKTTEANRFKK